MEGCEDEDSPYHLFAVVVHVGVGVNHGHYVCMVKSYDHWISFDDEVVEPIEESQLQIFFGSTNEQSGDTDHGYILEGYQLIRRFGDPIRGRTSRLWNGAISRTEYLAEISLYSYHILFVPS